MKRYMLSLCFVLGIAANLQAQTHPCDTTPPSNTNAPTTFKVGFCHQNQDVDGTPTVLMSAKVWIDGVVTQTWTTTNPAGLTPTGNNPNAAGDYYYETLSMTVSKGTHTVNMSVVDNAGNESALSANYSITVKVNPKPPTKPRLAP